MKQKITHIAHVLIGASIKFGIVALVVVIGWEQIDDRIEGFVSKITTPIEYVAASTTPSRSDEEKWKEDFRESEEGKKQHEAVDESAYLKAQRADLEERAEALREKELNFQ